ncbi:MAG: LysM peptidoglycan-binding domain-containing protein [Sulfuricaulis sp.]
MSPKHLLGSGFFLLSTVAVLLLTPPGVSRAQDVQLKADHPDRYTVVKGDTLWGISSRFLTSPWLWPNIWRNNQGIKNPQLIYPGDVIILHLVNGKPVLSVLRNKVVSAAAPIVPSPALPSLPAATVTAPAAPLPAPASGDRTVKLEPQVRSESLETAIPTIPPGAILPFLTYPLAVSKDELKQAGYVTVGLDERIALGDGSQFYARGLKDDGTEYYQVFRPSKPIYNPDTGELLAYQAEYLGQAQRLEAGDPSKLVVTEAKQEIIPTDRLLPVPKKASLPYYFPHAPKHQVHGRIVSSFSSVGDLGSLSVVGISLGTREGIEAGDVLRIMRHVGTAKDPVTHRTYEIPDEESGLLMVFRPYDKISYALIMTATIPVHMFDTVVTP